MNKLNIDFRNKERDNELSMGGNTSQITQYASPTSDSQKPGESKIYRNVKSPNVLKKYPKESVQNL